MRLYTSFNSLSQNVKLAAIKFVRASCWISWFHTYFKISLFFMAESTFIFLYPFLYFVSATGDKEQGFQNLHWTERIQIRFLSKGSW